MNNDWLYRYSADRKWLRLLKRIWLNSHLLSKWFDPRVNAENPNTKNTQNIDVLIRDAIFSPLSSRNPTQFAKSPSNIARCLLFMREFSTFYWISALAALISCVQSFAINRLPIDGRWVHKVLRDYHIKCLSYGDIIHWVFTHDWIFILR